MWHGLDRGCSVPVVTIITGLSYGNRSRLNKWHFLDLVCSVKVVTLATGISYSNNSLKKGCYLDLVCAFKSELAKKQGLFEGAPHKWIVYLASSCLMWI
jgi:hypothetical protein